MALSPGTRLGAYEILSLIGKGGMGEVYRAYDTKLGRDVALKLLPDAFTNDPERLARFRREAQVLASLNHPHIGAIYGLEETSGQQFLVLELVDGEGLNKRIARGAIPVEEALGIAKEIAEALEAAHEKGIIHRDLKPANIALTSDGKAKVLDFGLAKAMDPLSGVLADPDNSPTLTSPAMMTGIGVILGTAAYMSPEQAKGRPADKRSDLWAFGLVLMEMLTGRPVFTGETSSHVLAAVLNSDPDWTALPPEASPAIRKLLRRCLEKDSKRRLDSAADARLEIDDALAPATQADAPTVRPSRVGATGLLAAVAAGALIAGFATWGVIQHAPEATVLPVARFAIVPPVAQPLNVAGLDRSLALSPDGLRLVYRAGGSLVGGSPLLVRAIHELDAQPVPGVSGASGPFFSRDSRWIGFFDRGELKKVSIAGGPPIALCRISGSSQGASWGDDNTIVFATTDRTTGLWRVSADGGAATALTNPGAAERGGDHRFPSVLPGGRGVLFTIAAERQSDSAQVAVLDLKTGQQKTLIRGGSDAQYLDSGHLVYAGGGVLRAVQFDLARLEVLGEPVQVVDSVMMTSNGAANYAVSQRGTLVYVPGGAYAVTTSPRSLVWVDRQGREEPIKAPPRPYSVPRVSPDGARVAVELEDQENDIWIWDFARETLTRLTADAGFDVMPVWTPDSRRVIFASTRAGVPNVYAQRADGTGPVDRLLTSANTQMPTSITSDGTNVIGFVIDGVPANDVERSRVLLLRLPGSLSGQPAAASQTLFGGFLPEFSPDGRYIAYQSNESGTNEVYVRPFPQVDTGRWQVSTTGGTRPAWARNGRELFYLDASQKLTGVVVHSTSPTFIAGKPAKILDTKYANPFPARWFDVSTNGERFLMIKDNPAAEHATPIGMIVVEHWFDELKMRERAK